METVFRMLFESAPDSMIVTDRQGSILSANNQTERMFGYERSYLIGRQIEVLLPERLQVSHVDRRVNYFRDPSVRAMGPSQNLRGRRKDGSEFPVDIWLGPLETPEGTFALAVVRDATIRAERDALRQNEEVLLDFFESAPIPLHWVGLDGIILRANQAELDLLGLSREEYVDHHVAEFHADREVALDILQRLSRGETLKDYPARLRRKDGGIRHVVISSNVSWKDGKFDHTRCFTRDVTAQVHAEQARRTTEERYRSLVEFAPEGIVLHQGGKILYANPAASQLFAASDSEQLLSRPLSEIIHRDHQALLAERIQNPPVDHTTPDFMELKAVRFDGRTIDIEFVSLPLPDGEPRVQQAMIRDVTKRKLARDALGLYREIVANASDAIAVIGPYGAYIDQNEAHRQLLGYSDQELGSFTPAQHLGEETFSWIQRELQKTGSYHGELRSRHKNGSLTEIELVAFSIPGDSDTFQRHVLIMRDIRERKRAQDLILQQERELAVLQERNRLAGEIHDTLAQHFAGINFQVGSELARTSNIDPDLRRSLVRAQQMAQQGIHQSKAMVWDLVPIELEGRSLESALQAEIDKFCALGDWKVTFTLSGRRRKLYHKLEVALLRICQEALANVNQHAHAKAVDVRLAFTPRALSLSIQDDGVGFDFAKARIDGVRKKYGLTSMDGRARLLGGKLTVESAAGKGTTVRLDLPITSDGVEATAVHQEAPAGAHA